MQLADIARTSDQVAATASRSAKVALVAACLHAATAEELTVVVPWMTGRLRQRRTGLGWAALRDHPPPARTATLSVLEVDAAFARAEAMSGPGSQARRRTELHALLAQATVSEQRLLAGLVAGELRQGALDGVLLDAVAAAAGQAPAAVRRAVTLSGDVTTVAVAALTGPTAPAPDGLRVGRPLAPMLAQPAPDLAAALERTGPAGVEWKLDGIRVQLHRAGDEVHVFTRTLDEITDRVPEVVAAVRELDVPAAVLDGEVIALRPDGRPRPFQETAARTARHAGGADGATPLSLLLFDVLHLNGADVLDEPYASRRALLETAAPARLLVPAVRVEALEPEQTARAHEFAADALARGHEGVVVKALGAPYAMGRRGGAWVKVKPRHTLDLVVLAAEWGHGRRTGWLSNLHLGARDPAGRFGPPGGFVMLGKTFKGLSDAMLREQTARLQELACPQQERAWVVAVRPEMVVEVAFDGVQSSPRYPAGLALRFARVLRHRLDKTAAQADTIDMVAAVHQG